MEEIGQLRGYTIWREPNGVGGHRYWSDSIGGGVCVWDTCLGSIEELEFCIAYERAISAAPAVLSDAAALSTTPADR